MREILDAILAFIGAESLTDEEYESIDPDTLSTDLARYNYLLSVLDSRESVSSLQERLRYYYLAKGVQVPVVDSGKTNIFIGAPLCS